MDEDSKEDLDLYLFKAPSAGNETPAQDETGAIVGAVAACIIVSAVLLFLWKMLQRKKSEMHEITKDAEIAINNLPRSSENNKTKQIIKDISYRKNSNWKHIELPNSTMNIEDEFDAVNDKIRNEEIILPPVSPAPSSTWSQQDEMISSDTGYNSGFCRKEGALRRRYKQGPEELYMEHPRDILQSLKRDRQALRTERQNRAVKIRKAIDILDECQELIQRTKQKISVYSKEKLEALEQIRKSRKERKLNEMKRKHWKKWNSLQQCNYDKKEAFVAMQEWFDGLHLHLSTKQVAEEVFLLRSFHRSDIEKNEFEKQSVCDSATFLGNCLEDVAKTREDVRGWQKEFSPTAVTTGDAKPDESLSAETGKREAQTRQRIMLSRIFKKKAVRPAQVDTGTADPEWGEDVENKDFCPNCHQPLCQCEQKVNEDSLTTSPFTNSRFTFSKAVDNNQLHSTAVSAFATEEPDDATQVTALEQTEVFRLTPTTHILTLKLREILPPGVITSSESDEISEREVQKALRRVPSILSLNSVRKDSNNTWTVVAESSASRVANIRFNCRGKPYVIGMSS